MGSSSYFFSLPICLVTLILCFILTLTNAAYIGTCKLQKTEDNTSNSPLAGNLTFYQSDMNDGVQVTGTVGEFASHLERGFHVHTFGDIQSPNRLGPHFSSDNQIHALPQESKSNSSITRHFGDMGNIEVERYYETAVLDGSRWKFENMQLFGENSILGRAVGLVDGRDEGYSNQPSGGGGNVDYFCVIGRTENSDAEQPIQTIPSGDEAMGTASMKESNGFAYLKLWSLSSDTTALRGYLTRFEPDTYQLTGFMNGDQINGMNGEIYLREEISVNSSDGTTCIGIDIDRPLNDLYGSGIRIQSTSNATVSFDAVLGILSLSNKVVSSDCDFDGSDSESNLSSIASLPSRIYGGSLMMIIGVQSFLMITFSLAYYY
eukprot:gb/GECH01008577.1/.p1 GENE.gb/GECH01008577.1/~~gb/GECH01008577.1/.p1  ORF type:complete len:376 (+),score=69.45 gb/GECH01008577.1/:1-1128(+)